MLIALMKEFLEKLSVLKAMRGVSDFVADHSEFATTGDVIREYKSYEHYVSHQKSKARMLSGFKEFRVEHFKNEFSTSKLFPEVGSSILCVGARFGEEVYALRSMGYLAIGIDLEPTHSNSYVLRGDVHKIDFPNEVFSAVFSNILDHILFLEIALAEIKRVTKKPGRVILHLNDQTPKQFEARGWSNPSEFARKNR